MKSSHNQAPSSRRPLKSLLAASVIAVASSGIPSGAEAAASAPTNAASSATAPKLPSSVRLTQSSPQVNVGAYRAYSSEYPWNFFATAFGAVQASNEIIVLAKNARAAGWKVNSFSRGINSMVSPDGQVYNTTPGIIAALESNTTSVNASTINKLTGVILGLENGQSAEVTARPVIIPGPISSATGQPIVFEDGDDEYFAYTQEHEPRFYGTTPGSLASSMVIFDVGHYEGPLTQAYLDKKDILVNESEVAVGYSTGGEAGK